MADEERSTFLARFSKAARMNQEPRDRMWGIIIVVTILVLALGALLAETRLFLTEGQTLGYQRGAVDCLILITDDDRRFELPDYCHNGNVVIYYPDIVCDEFFSEDERCGREEG